MIWIVWDGHDISFWYDNWIENQSLRELLNLDDDTSLNPSIKVSDFIRNKQNDTCKLLQAIDKSRHSS